MTLIMRMMMMIAFITIKSSLVPLIEGHADVSDGKDLLCHQQEVTDGQLVTLSLVPGTVDSDVALECHLCCPPPLPTEEVSSVDCS